MLVISINRFSHQIRAFSALGVAFALGACAKPETCEEPQFYELAESGKRLEAPDDLSNVAGYKELTIPEASPRPPRDRSAGCLDKPPSLNIGGSDEETETP